MTKTRGGGTLKEMDDGRSSSSARLVPRAHQRNTPARMTTETNANGVAARTERGGVLPPSLGLEMGWKECTSRVMHCCWYRVTPCPEI